MRAMHALFDLFCLSLSVCLRSSVFCLFPSSILYLPTFLIFCLSYLTFYSLFSVLCLLSCCWIAFQSNTLHVTVFSQISRLSVLSLFFLTCTCFLADFLMFQKKWSTGSGSIDMHDLIRLTSRIRMHDARVIRSAAYSVVEYYVQL